MTPPRVRFETDRALTQWPQISGRPTETKVNYNMAANPNTWLDDITSAMRHLGGIATLSELHDEIIQMRPNLPQSWQEVISRVIQNHSSDASDYNGNFTDIFYAVDGIGKGRWGLREMRDKPATTPPFVVHYALDLEKPPLVACEHPDPVRYSTFPTDVTCADCMTHEEFPMLALMPRVTARKVLAEASSLLSEKGENPEYDRAIVELTSALIGAGPDDRILMTRILRALSETEH